MTCFQLRRKWWHRLIIGGALVMAALSAGAVGFITPDDTQALGKVFGAPVVGPILVFAAVFFSIFVPYRVLVRIFAGKISN